MLGNRTCSSGSLSLGKLSLWAGVLAGLIGLVACGRSGPDAQRSELDYFSRYSNFDANFFADGGGRIALTFDDGPNPHNTPKILSVLKEINQTRSPERKIRATFFVLGQNAKGKEALLRQIVDDGHLLANHSSNHEAMVGLKADAIFKMVKDTDAIIRPFNQAKGNSLYFYRAPYGEWEARLAELLNSDQRTASYIGPVFWHVGGDVMTAHDSKGVVAYLSDAADWKCPSLGLGAWDCAQGYIRKTLWKNGGIVLMHDVPYATSEILRYYLNALADRFEFIRMDEIPNVETFAGPSGRTPVIPTPVITAPETPPTVTPSTKPVIDTGPSVPTTPANPCKANWNPDLVTCLNAAMTDFCDLSKGKACAPAACQHHRVIACRGGCLPQPTGTPDKCLE